jgi:hypothetical protein
MLSVYYHEPAHKLKHFGYRIEKRARGDFEIEAVSEQVCNRFSKRDNRIDEALKKPLETRPELACSNLKDLREELATTDEPVNMACIWDKCLAAKQVVNCKLKRPTRVSFSNRYHCMKGIFCFQRAKPASRILVMAEDYMILLCSKHSHFVLITEFCQNRIKTNNTYINL